MSVAVAGNAPSKRTSVVVVVSGKTHLAKLALISWRAFASENQLNGQNSDKNVGH
jgi:hypothetical protein